ncbi:MAG: type I polyketide synthase [Hydrogenophaga sp.]|uniref:type I polyketide synthase n=1 Tax=Hydrogenophaga sp. TaxID=1904254 RepID=UPI001E049C9A|nr:type I polyketide synthase [Hydrogenophaga sp.]MBX3611469.1 type I polyketide synthase [Hydrogenophaga sp.]
MSDKPSSPSLGGLSAVKLALMAQQVRAQSEAVLKADPVAIVGMGCRFPGGADTPEAFWDLLANGVDAVRAVPPDRWDAKSLYDPDPSAPAKAVTQWGGFLDRIDGFDAAYFNILPREAERMDPQHRLFLEVAMEALDDAGLTRARLRGSRTGAFVASYHNDYQLLEYRDHEAIDARTLTGTVHSVLVNRLSYLLDLRGPSISVDTACSSSLVAIHLACQSLRHGESDIALAGGVSLMVTPDLMVSLSKVGFMAPDGRCKTFDDRADGFGRGEGCGVIVLKRLSDAIADGDRVLGVVRGSAVNQDGHSTLLAAPNGLAQQDLIREALASAQLEPGRIGFVEAHGTGTPLGDPIEVEALAATVGRADAGGGTCWLGAAKANLAHMEAAAGVAGVIKTVLAMQHEAIPPQIHFTSLNRHLSLEGTRLAVPTSLTPWPRGGKPRCAGTSSFGVGGTNAHVIIEEPPRLGSAGDAGGAASPYLLCLSAQSESALRDLAVRWIDFLGRSRDSLRDICYTAGARRSALDHRLALVGDDREALRSRLEAFLREESPPGLSAGRVPTDVLPRLAFVFSGQGPQWFAMGRELMASEPVFRDTMARCDALVKAETGWSLLAELAADEAASRLDQTAIAQPALFAIQVALAALWASWGIRPDGVVGHSVGELAALHVAGVLGLDEAVRVVCLRGRVMQRATGSGRMAAVDLDEADALALLGPLGDRLSLAAVNAPRSVVLSGEPAALEEALAALTARGVNHRMLPVQYAFHSAQMAPLQRELVAALGAVATGPAAIPVYSTVTGAGATRERFDATYFGRNVREPVRLQGAIAAMVEDGHTAFLEIGPHPVLGGAVAATLEALGCDATVAASLRRGRPERESLMASAAALHSAGHTPDVQALLGGPGDVVSLPRYPWQRKRFWLRPTPQPGPTMPATAHVHPLLGVRVPLADPRLQVFECHWTAHSAGSLDDHRIGGRLLMPAAAMAEVLLAASQMSSGHVARAIDGLVLDRSMVLPDAGERCWQVHVREEGDMTQVELFQAIETGWQRICGASVLREAPEPALSIGEANEQGLAVDHDTFYQRFEALGVAFGPGFRTVQGLTGGAGWARGRLVLPDACAEQAVRFGLHPGLLDGALQVCAAASAEAADGLPDRLWAPMGVGRMIVWRAGASRLRAHARVHLEAGGQTLVADVHIEDEEGHPVASLSQARFTRTDARRLEGGGRDDWLHRLHWYERAPSAQAADVRAEGTWLLLADDSPLLDSLRSAIQSLGGRCVQVRAGLARERDLEDRWSVNPASPEDLAAVLQAVGPVRAAIHLWGLDADAVEPQDPARAELLCSGGLLHLAQALVAQGQPAALTLVTRAAQATNEAEVPSTLAAAGAWAFLGVVRVEHPELSARAIDLSATDEDGAALARLLLAPGSQPDLAVRHGRQLQRRLEVVGEPGAAVAVPQRRLEVVRAGTLDGLALRPLVARALKTGEVRIAVAAAALNFRDVLLALGVYPGEGIALGAECAGTVIEVGPGVDQPRVGERVFGFAHDSMGSEAVVPAAFVYPMPPDLSFDQAAALPVAYLTAHHGLHAIAGLQRGQRVLIHAGAGGVGMAAVQLALRAGAEVYATAGSPGKRAFLQALGVSHVFDSRSTSFATELLTLTAGEGVQLVLNSLAGEFIPAGLSVVAPQGWFLELGKRDIWTAEEVAQSHPKVRYRAFDFGDEAYANPAIVRPMLADVLAGIARGELRTLPVTAFGIEHAAEAFRYMAQARHIGKLVLRLPAMPIGVDLQVRADASYLITGGLGALGLHTARWLHDAGARHLVLVGRRDPGPEAQTAIDALRAAGAQVHVVAADAANETAMQALLSELARDMPPLRGVVHAAGVIDDGALIRQTWPRCAAVLRQKVRGAQVLDRLTRPLALDFFVLYSAAGQWLGAPGQCAYAAANAQLDALTGMRRAHGQAALSVAWGMWGDGGMASRLADRGQDPWGERGLGRIDAEGGMARLERLLREGVTQAIVLPIDWARFLATLPPGLDPNFFPGAATQAARPADVPAQVSLADSMRRLPASQRRAALMAHLRERALQVLGLEAATQVDPTRALKELGLDSLMAVELRNALTRSVGKPLPATLLFDYPNLNALTDHLARVLGLDEARAPSTVPAAATPVAADLASLSEEEAEAQLLQELSGGGIQS